MSTTAYIYNQVFNDATLNCVNHLIAKRFAFKAVAKYNDDPNKSFGRVCNTILKTVKEAKDEQDLISNPPKHTENIHKPAGDIKMLSRKTKYKYVVKESSHRKYRILKINTKDKTDFTNVFSGTIQDCNAWLNLNDKGYFV